jgi:TonB family protein
MKRFILIALLLLAATALAYGQDAQTEVKRELTEGALLYKDGNFVEAQRHFERALELDPANKNAPVFIARAIQQQYRPGVDTPENVSKGMEAIEAYKRVLTDDPDNEDAYNAVAFLYRQMKNEEREREWLFMRAELPSAPPEKRADAYTVLASKDWNCSYEITEQRANKRLVRPTKARVVIEYLKPKAQADFDKAKACAVEGLDLVGQAIALFPGHKHAWAYKSNLLRELSKLAQMEGNATAKADFDRLAGEAEAKHKELNEEAARIVADSSKVEVTVESSTPSSPDTASEGASAGRTTAAVTGTVISGGVLNGKAVSKPPPVYPPIARAARASGTVVVQITVDEEGNVIAAQAVSGHPLLQAAAVAAARRARLSPTRLSGQPVKVTGILTYNFVLE